MRFRDKWVVGLVWVLVAVSVLVADLGPVELASAGDATMGTTDKVQRYRMAIQSVPAADGGLTNAADYAAHEWHPGTYRPYRPDGPEGYTWPILAYFKDNRRPLVVWYWGGSFRSSNGGNWGQPERWAYIRYYQEVWDPAGKQWRVPGLDPAIVPPVTVPPRGTFQIPKSMQYQVDALKLRYTTKEIMDAMDASPYDEPSEGAPEPSAGGTE